MLPTLPPDPLMQVKRHLRVGYKLPLGLIGRFGDTIFLETDEFCPPFSCLMNEAQDLFDISPSILSCLHLNSCNGYPHSMPFS